MMYESILRYMIGVTPRKTFDLSLDNECCRKRREVSLMRRTLGDGFPNLGLYG